ncbi:hypothetical protein EZH22_14040 [Xanthobacter dioxanivorans]|uniref:Uncharacterized protein n=1 Tax=Xanthobacter dioxanivorans TaxID=2528964 RepID=A0A974PU43_9HYPH|nr:hypothetical protein [Xanthobacter dioxanivorans]QRG09273.1 hypothetical protein EZH22_14040 [Xanthobacter dioxanivorans]
MLNDPAAMRGLLLTYSEKVLTLESENQALGDKARRWIGSQSSSASADWPPA